VVEGAAQSYWMASTKPPTYPALSGHVEADVAVVGAGIAGISAAWEIARTGRSVVLLEADRIAAGVSGYTTGRLSAAHPWIYRPLREGLGAESARLYARSQQDAVDHMIRTADRLGIDCDVEVRASHVYVEPGDGRLDDLKAETDAAREAGLDASFVTETDLPYEVGGAMRVEDQVQFHPRRYLLGLADDLTKAGGRIFERSRVTGLDRGSGPLRATTADGATVTAEDVVIATLFPLFDRGRLTLRLSPLRELVIAAPIDADRDPGAMYITRADNTRSVRTAPYRDGQRLLLVTGESFPPGTTDVDCHQRELVEWTREHFKIDDVAYWWSAQDLDTADKVPYVGRLDDHLYVATGFARSGMSHGIMSGRLIADLIDGTEPPWTDLYAPRRLDVGREAGPVLKTAMSQGKEFLSGRLRARPTEPSEIPPGSGAVVRHHGRPCAVYHATDGTTHMLSAACPHMGCIVDFNDTEQVWECPCHGSRFAPDGAVLQGPATTSLKPHQDPS
jgi:glycine/D-amino acid oxidase-like deaminating enzyme/nitrite reductase/ring-hydroxylating ferredoxin subunit